MIYRKQNHRSGLPGGFFTLKDGENTTISGPGDGEFIFLRDEEGNRWRGLAERQPDNTIRYRFRDERGRYLSGVSDGQGITLRDEKGNTWHGFID